VKKLNVKIRFVFAMLIALSPLGVSADIIYFKDGMKTICQEKAWEENGEIKCEYEGVVLFYNKADVHRIKKIRTKKPVADRTDKPKIPEKSSTKKVGVQATPPKPGALTFYDPRRTHKYWTDAKTGHKTYQEAIAALAKQYGRTPDWVKSRMGETNDLNQIHHNLSAGKRPNAQPPAKITLKDSSALEFYNPRRTDKYWTSKTARHSTFHEAIAALAKQYERTSDWVKSHMGETNDLNQIHQNLVRQQQEEKSQ
jgi:hypothetical protein